MRFAPIVSLLMTCLALNAETLQGKVVRGADGDTITILDEAKVQGGMAWHFKRFGNTPTYAQAENGAREAKRGLWQDKSPIEPESFRKAKRPGKGTSK